MSDIFISYAREQRAEAKSLAEQLRARHYRVWWDTDMVGGGDIDQVIRARIKEAKAVIVIWSAEATASPYVRGEASMAAGLTKLVPAKLSNVTIDDLPIAFREINTIELTDTIALEKSLNHLGAHPNPPPGTPIPQNPSGKWPEPSRQLPMRAPASPTLKLLGAAAAVAVVIGLVFVYRDWSYWNDQKAKFDAAMTANQIEVLATYLDARPDQFYELQARPRFNELRDSLKAAAQGQFDSARSTGTVEAWKLFRDSYSPFEKFLPGEWLETAERMIKECEGVPFYDSSNKRFLGPEAARWCADPWGATLTINGQRLAGTCRNYVEKYGPVHQNELGRQAVSDAKYRNDDLALEKIVACQCHNPPVQQQISQPEERHRMICWLRSQPLPG